MNFLKRFRPFYQLRRGPGFKHFLSIGSSSIKCNDNVRAECGEVTSVMPSPGPGAEGVRAV